MTVSGALSEGGIFYHSILQKMSSNFPGVYHDEYRRAYCAAHHREDCHICCMSFSMINEQIDENPSDRE